MNCGLQTKQFHISKKPFAIRWKTFFSMCLSSYTSKMFIIEFLKCSELDGIFGKIAKKAIRRNQSKSLNSCVSINKWYNKIKHDDIYLTEPLRFRIVYAIVCKHFLIIARDCCSHRLLTRKCCHKLKNFEKI